MRDKSIQKLWRVTTAETADPSDPRYNSLMAVPVTPGVSGLPTAPQRVLRRRWTKPDWLIFFTTNSPDNLEAGALITVREGRHGTVVERVHQSWSHILRPVNRRLYSLGSDHVHPSELLAVRQRLRLENAGVDMRLFVKSIVQCVALVMVLYGVTSTTITKPRNEETDGERLIDLI